MTPLSTAAAFTALAALTQAQWNDVPPSNDSATNPWWPQYPEGTSKDDFMLNDTSNDEDLKGNSRIAKWIVTTSNVWRAQFGEYSAAECCRREVRLSRRSGQDRPATSRGLQVLMGVASYHCPWRPSWSILGIASPAIGRRRPASPR